MSAIQTSLANYDRLERAARGTARAAHLPPRPRLVTTTSPRVRRDGRVDLVTTATVRDAVAAPGAAQAAALAVTKAALRRELARITAAMLQHAFPQGQRATAASQRAAILKKLGMRTPADRKFLADLDAKNAKVAAIMRRQAMLSAQIDRLSPAAAARWTPTFPGLAR